MGRSPHRAIYVLGVLKIENACTKLEMCVWTHTRLKMSAEANFENSKVCSPIVNGPNVSGQTVSHTTSRALKVVGPIVSGPSLNGPLVC